MGNLYVKMSDSKFFLNRKGRTPLHGFPIERPDFIYLFRPILNFRKPRHSDKYSKVKVAIVVEDDQKARMRMTRRLPFQ